MSFNLRTMGKKNGSKKRDKRNFLKKVDDLCTIFTQENFNEEHRWYRMVEEVEEVVENNAMKEVVKVNNSKVDDSLQQRVCSEGKLKPPMFQSVDIRYKKK